MQLYFRVGVAAVLLGMASGAAAQQDRGAAADTARADSLGRRTLSGELIRSLPVDDAASLMRFLPGTRGATDQAEAFRSRFTPLNVYVDGVPVRSWQALGPAYLPGTRNVSRFSVLTAPPAWLGGAAVQSLETVRAGTSLTGDVRVLSDALSPTGWSQQATRLELGASGPTGGIAGLSFAIHGEIDGAGYTQQEVDRPDGFAMTGVDTVIKLRRTSTFQGANSDSVQVVVPLFEPLAGDRLPLGSDWGTNVSAALTLDRGAGSYALRLHHSAGRAVFRTIDQMYNPDGWLGRDDVARMITGSGRWQLGGVSADLVVSHQKTTRVEGAVLSQWAADNLHSSHGLALGAPEFLVGDRSRWPVTDELLTALRNGILPFDAYRLVVGDNPAFYRRQGVMGVSQSLRLNPYGGSSGFPVGGYHSAEPAGTWSDESRLYARGAIGAEMAGIALTAGGELDRATVESMTLPLMNGGPVAFRDRPSLAAAFIHGVRGFGAISVDGGLRLERYASEALLPALPGFVSNLPDSLRGDAWRLRPGTEPWEQRLERVEDCGGEATAAWRRNPSGQIVCRDNMRPVAAQTGISPRLSATWDGGGPVAVRAAVGMYLQAPVMATLPSNLGVGASAVQPSELDLVQDRVFELGARVRMGSRSQVNAVLFRHGTPNPVGTRQVQVRNPITGGTVNVRVLGHLDAVATTGLELSASQEIGAWASATGHVTLSQSDLFGESQTDPASAAAILRLEPGRIRTGETAGVLGDLAIHVTGTWTGGPRYTSLRNEGSGTLVDRSRPLAVWLFGTPDGELNGEAMPAWKTLDVRVSRGFRVGGVHSSIILDVRNPLGIRNVRTLYAETGTTESELYRLDRIAQVRGQWLMWQDMVIDEWPENAVNLHMLRRTEQRYGNGDGIFTRDEFDAAVGAYFDFAENAHTQRARELRLGVEVRF